MGDAQDARRSAPLSTPQETASRLERALERLAWTRTPPAAPSASEVAAIVGSPAESVSVTPREAVVGDPQRR